MLFIEAERMANGLYEPEECESERTVIISELEGGENDPEQLLDMEVNAAAFKAHPYGIPTIGWLSDLRRMTRDDLYGYYRRYYVPNNATLVVVGDVEGDDVLRRVNQHFGTIRPGVVPPRALSVEPEQLGERRVVVERPGTAAYLKLAYHAPAADDPAFVPLLPGRRRADRREGHQSLGEFPHAAAAAQCPPVSGARRRATRIVGVPEVWFRRPIRSCTRFR